MPDRSAPPDLSPLNDAERVVLGLLARGHTAKSIATLTGRSVGAVNERLREARRKTGVGSSRELARMLAVKENRDELIGVVPDADVPPPLDPPDTAPRRRPWGWIGGIGMMLMAVALGAAVLAGQGADTAPPPVEELDRMLAAEPRDAAWAEQAERALDDIYAPVPNVGPVTVRCRRTLCVVSGEIVPVERAHAVEALRDRGIGARVRAAGFAGQPAIGVTDDAAGPVRFVILWRRA